MRIMLGALVFMAANAVAWFQTNSMILNKWASDNSLLIALILSPIAGMLYAHGTKFLYGELSSLWSVRFISFGISYMVFIPLTWYFFGEQVFTIKNVISFFLCVALISIQFLLK